MPTVAATRTIAAGPDAVWAVVGDPHHLPRWWPRVLRVEGVQERAFTEVLMGRRGKVLRADFDLVEVQDARRVVWSQQVQGTPFEGVLQRAVTTVELAPGARGARREGTEVRIELAQQLAGGRVGSAAWRPFSLARFGRPLVTRAASGTVEQALDGLERVFGDGD